MKALLNCAAQVDCKASEFRCPVEAACIPAGWRCDGNNDCRDGADEADCGQ